MRYMFSLVSEKLKMVDALLLRNKSDHFGFYQIFTLSKLNENINFSLKHLLQRNKLFRLYHHVEDKKMKRNLKLLFNSMIEKDRETVFKFLSTLKIEDDYSYEDSSRNFNKKGMIGILNYQYDL